MFKRTISAALVFGAVALAPPATAQSSTPCMERAKMVERLADKYHESQTALGLQNAGQMIEIWSSAETGSFSVLLTRADGISCMVSSGTFWQTIQPVVAKPETTG